jgi:NAD+ kinase
MSAGGSAAAPAIASATVHTHRLPEVTHVLVEQLIETADRLGIELRFDREETEKHRILERAGSAVRANHDGSERGDVCIVLGGDGTTLRALRSNVGSGVPVFSINCGRVGFLATIDRADAPSGLARALTGDFEVALLPSLLLDSPVGAFALNEVSFQRGSHTNVAHLGFELAGEEIVRAPCDGVIAATPMGSTAYNLSAGGPILAWGLEGFVVSMVAPHALSARAVVAAPADALRVQNQGSEAVDVVVDGMRAGDIAPGERSEVRFSADAVGLAQLPGFSFYGRFREKLRLLTGDRSTT